MESVVPPIPIPTGSVDPETQYVRHGAVHRANVSYTRNHLSEILARLSPIEGTPLAETPWQGDLVRRGLIRLATCWQIGRSEDEVLGRIRAGATPGPRGPRSRRSNPVFTGLPCGGEPRSSACPRSWAWSVKGTSIRGSWPKPSEDWTHSDNPGTRSYPPRPVAAPRNGCCASMPFVPRTHSSWRPP